RPGQRVVVAGDIERQVLPFFGIDLLNVLCYGAKIRFSLRHAYARFQCGSDVKEMAASLFLHLRSWLDGQPEPLVQVFSHHFRKAKAVRHNTDDSSWLPVYSHGLSDNSAVGIEAVAPQPFRKQDYLWTIRLALIVGKRPAHQRRDAEQLE